MQLGDKIPAYLQLYNGATNKFPQAFTRDGSNIQIPNSPVDLAHINNGLYGNTDLLMPSADFVTVQYVVYDDVDHFDVSASQGGIMEIYFTGSGLQEGNIIPVYTQLSDYDTHKHPQAIVRDGNGDLIGQVNLTHIALGMYGNTTLVMPDTQFVTVQVLIYDDAGHTIPSNDESDNSYTLVRGDNTVPSYAPVYFPVVGFVDGREPCQTCPPAQDVIVKGEAHTLALRLVSGTNWEAVDLSDVTAVECRFLNADMTVLSVKSSDIGVPVIIDSPGGGKISCTIAAAQSALLMAQEPAPFTVVLTRPAGKTVVNFPYQLFIVEMAV